MTRKGKTIDNYHGFEIADPFRWLEDARSSEVQEWTALQDASAREFLAGIPQREELRQRLEELWRYTRYSAPAKHAGSYFFQKAEGLQNQPVLYSRSARTVATWLMPALTAGVTGRTSWFVTWRPDRIWTTT